MQFRWRDAIIVDKDENVIVCAERVENLYYVKKRVDSANAVETNFCPSNELDVWHCRMEHLNERDLKGMAKSNVVYGLDFKPEQRLSTCEVCTRKTNTSYLFEE